MKKDIKIPEVKNVCMAIVKLGDNDWKVYLINNNKTAIHDTLVVTKGYGQKEGVDVKTSTLRHQVGTVEAQKHGVVERIDPDLFILNHEFWVTYYIEGVIYDKKFVFHSESLSEKNLSYIHELDETGIIHTS